MKHVLVGLGAALILLGTVLPVGAQGRQVRLDGRVQWIAGQMAIVNLESGAVVHVDLTRVRQDEYSGLKTRERVIVIGLISEDGNRVTATSVTREARIDQAPARRVD